MYKCWTGLDWITNLSMQVYWDLGEWSAGTLEDLPSLNAHSGHPLQPHSQALHSFPDRKKATHTLYTYAMRRDWSANEEHWSGNQISPFRDCLHTRQENLVGERASLVTVMSTALLCASEL